ncbi:Hypothetical protein PHPALM_20596 [Phytophthora palmivora]|uniref:Uncharacterized protein n=1 Tax=Phytophthora palmivora TaxID=4796 RepID=A0A2P4XEG5_9STRA|nr:Hypothetical protein PHPALM_20596 [Phytophthora palmivora]
MIKRNVAGPVKAFACMLARHCEAVVVDECRASKKHFDCQTTGDLENQQVPRRSLFTRCYIVCASMAGVGSRLAET